MTTISVITPTFNREDLLARCVESVLAQQVENAGIEHIVVNDYGQPLQRAVAWRDDPRTRVVDTFRTERSVARNTGAALSRGDWLFFLDDDYVLPRAFAALLEVAARHPRAVKVYGGYQIVDQTTGAAQTLQSGPAGDASAIFMAGEGLPPQATWVRRHAFFRAGCFDPLLSAAEDADLNRRVGLLGEVAGTPFVVAVVRVNHAATSTTDYARHQQFFHAALEKSLQMPETLGKVVHSSQRTPYWRGRCAREYLASAFRNARARRFGTACSRLTGAGRLALSHLHAPAFWRGVRRRSQA